MRDYFGGLHSPELLIRSLDFARIEGLQTSGKWDEAAQILNVGEYHLRHRLREDVCVVRGVTVTRLTAKRKGNYRKAA